MVSEKLGCVPREDMGKTMWVKTPTAPAITSSGPTRRRLLLPPADLHIPSASAAPRKAVEGQTPTIKGQTGKSRAVSSLIHWSRKLYPG